MKLSTKHPLVMGIYHLINKDHSVFKENFSSKQHYGLILSCANLFIDWHWFSGERCGPWASCFISLKRNKQVSFLAHLNQRLMSFSDQNLSVVHRCRHWRCWRCCQFCYKLFTFLNFFSRTNFNQTLHKAFLGDEDSQLSK